MASVAAFRFDNSFARELEGLYVPWRPAAVRAPRLLFFNHALAAELGLDVASFDGPAGAATFAGNAVPEGAEPIAQAYAGHQFGGFSPQLGDGRALLLGEVIDRRGRRRDIALKGSGRTPFARGGDGKAAVGPMLREVLLGEAMHALRIPTTRALAVAATGEPVYREHELPGAVLTRVAASHIRVGTFEFFASRGDMESLRKLAEYTIARHDPELVSAPQRFLALLRNVAERQAALVAQWMNVGFIHGVMNTDNMAISGETIDYGPCAFMEAFDPATVFSSIDRRGRYAFGNQPDIACWNLARLAESLLPLLSDDPEQAAAMATEVIAAFPAQYGRHLLRGQRAKLGLRRGEPDDDSVDVALAEDWLTLASWRPGGFHPWLAAARRRRGRRRHGLARAVRGRTPPRRMAHALAGTLRQRGRQRRAWLGVGRRRTRRCDAQRQSLGHRAQPPRGGGARCGLGRGRPRAVRAVARCPAAAVRRDSRPGPVRRAGARRRDRVLPHVLRHLTNDDPHLQRDYHPQVLE